MPSLQGFIRAPNGALVVTDKKAPYGKITGTRLAAVVGKSRWDTPFTAIAKIMRLFNEELDSKELRAGTVIEPKILEYIGATPGDVIFGERKGNHEEWKSDFDDEIFGGHIDGQMPDGSIVEVKTTKNPEDWLNGPPEYYWIQASLYAHFLGTDKIIFMVGFTDADILADPDSFVCNEKTVARYDVGIIPGFDDMLRKARDIYLSTVAADHTPIPDFSNPNDYRVFELLNAQIWDEKDVKARVDDLVNLQARMNDYKDIEKKVSEAKERLSMYMGTHDVEVVNGTNFDVKINKITKQIVDTDALKRDGVFNIYTKKAEYEMLRVVRRK